MAKSVMPERYCLYCGKRIYPLPGYSPSSIRDKKFCSSSHAAKYNRSHKNKPRVIDKYSSMRFRNSVVGITWGEIGNLYLETQILSEMGLM